MTKKLKKRSSEILADENRIFLGKRQNWEILSPESDKFWETGGKSETEGNACMGWTPLFRVFDRQMQDIFAVYKNVPFYKSQLRGRPSPLSQWCMLHIPPYFHKIYNCPHISAKFVHFPPISAKFTFFCLICVFSFPYFDYNVSMHHALHVLNASGSCYIAIAITAIMTHENQSTQQ